MEYLQTQFSPPLLFLSSFTTPTDYRDDTTCFNIHFGNPESILNEWVFHKVLYKEVLWKQRVHFLLGLVDEAPLRDNLHSSQDLPLPPPIIQPTPPFHTWADLLNPGAGQERRVADSEQISSDPRSGATLFTSIPYLLFPVRSISFASRFPAR